MSDTTNGEVYEGGDVDTESGELSHEAPKLEELIIVDSSTERNKKERTESSTQTEEFEYMFSRPNDASFEREDMRNDEKVLFYTGLPSFEVLEACSPSCLKKIVKSYKVPGTCYGIDKSKT